MMDWLRRRQAGGNRRRDGLRGASVRMPIPWQAPARVKRNHELWQVIGEDLLPKSALDFVLAAELRRHDEWDRAADFCQLHGCPKHIACQLQTLFNGVVATICGG